MPTSRKTLTPSMPLALPILEIVQETPDTRTFIFDSPIDADSGQFLMVWIPGLDEIPMSVSVAGERTGITVRKVGEATEALFQLKPGDRLGLRGPLGNGFKLEGRKLLFVAGGVGTAPLMLAIEKAVAEGMDVTVALGALTKDGLLFWKRIESLGIVPHIATDDGSEGHHGFITEVVADLLEKGDFDQILTCGPELMMKKLVAMAAEKSIPIQCSVERHMKCGMGICDSCSVDGLQVCRDGPVFSGEAIAGLSEFGKFHRDASGRKTPL